MFRLAVACLVLASACAPADSAPPLEEAAHPEEDAVIAAAVKVLNAITNEDTVLLKEGMTENGTFYAVAGDSSVQLSTVPDMTARFTAGPDFMERMWEPEVSISGRLAMVWTPYDFWIDQEFSHCGIDVFHLARMGSQWKVLSIAFTRETEDCPPSPLGPPRF